MPSNSVIYALVLVHTLASGYHGWSHSVAGVTTTVAQTIFIATAIFSAPMLAALLLVRRRTHIGIALFSLSMLGSLVFGMVFHFMLDAPDLCANVRGLGARVFLVSAVLLTAVDLTGFAWGAYCWRSHMAVRSSGTPRKHRAA